MIKNIRLLLAICLLAMAGLVALQFFWMKSYYKTSLFNFEREVNLAFEDAIKRDAQLRCDTIEELLVNKLMDTSYFTIHSKYLPAFRKMSYRITNATNKKNITFISQMDLSNSLRDGDTAYKRKIARAFAHIMRTEDLENHVVYYRLQSLGDFTFDKMKQFGFDTGTFRPVLQQYLHQRNIFIQFYFLLNTNDSLFNSTKLPDSIKRKDFVLTKAMPTYKWQANKAQYVRVIFESPIRYVFSKIKWMLAGSLLLTALMALCIWLLLKALFHEKKLSIIKNDFINNITHELKTPVATIAAAIETLENDDLSRDKQVRFLGFAKNETTRLTKLIESILNISLQEKNRLQILPGPIDVEKIINEAVEHLRVASDKIINYQYLNIAGLKEVQADKELFKQAIMNVLDNAIKYSGAEVDINIKCFMNNRSFHIQCSDNGEGIAMDSMPYIFEKFYREPKPDHAIKGHGLGLNYVQKIMHAHNGKVEVRSIKGKGTIVVLSWPV